MSFPRIANIAAGGYSSGLYFPAGWGAKLQLAVAAGNPHGIWVGESTSQGYFASGSNFANGVAGKVIQALQTQFGDGGSGFVSSANIYATGSASGQPYLAYNNAGNPFVATPASWYWQNPGDGLLTSLRNWTGAGTGTADTLTYPPASCRGTSITVISEAFAASGGNINWTIDGVAQAVISSVSGAGTPTIVVTTVGGLAPGSHTVVFTTGAVRFGLCGVKGFNAGGFLFDNLGRAGQRTLDIAGQFNPIYNLTWNNATSYPLNSLVYYSPVIGTWTSQSTGYYVALAATTIGHAPIAFPAEWAPIPMSTVSALWSPFCQWAGGAKNPTDLLIVEIGGNDCTPQSFYGGVPVPVDAFIDNTRLFLQGVLESYGTAGGRAGMPPDLLFTMPHIGSFESQVSTSGNSQPFGAYALRLRALAEELGAAFYAPWAAMRPSVNWLQSEGYWGAHLGPAGSAGATSADNPHMSDAGHAAWAAGISPLILAACSSIPIPALQP